MRGMNSEVYAALIEADASEDRTREAAKSVVRCNTDFVEMKASLLLIRWIVGFNHTFAVANVWCIRLTSHTVNPTLSCP